MSTSSAASKITKSTSPRGDAGSKVTTVPALTVRQPWATCIALGYKRVENRTWRTAYRGDIMIHAAARLDRRLCDDFGADMRAAGLYWPEALETGGLIAVVRLVDIIAPDDALDALEECDRDWYTPGSCAWILDDACPVAYVPMRGRLGLWHVDASLVRCVDATG